MEIVNDFALSRSTRLFRYLFERGIRLASLIFRKRVWFQLRNFPNLVFSFRLNDIIGRYLRVFGVWEPFQTSLTLEKLKSGDICVDIGSHHGYYTLLMSRKVGPEGHVYSFDPSREASQVLKEHLEVNSIENVTFFNNAVGMRGELYSFFADGGLRNSGDSHLVNVGEDLSRGVEYVVTIKALDDFDMINFEKVKVIKIDVEGFENHVFAGAIRSLSMLPIGAQIFLEVMKPAGRVLKEILCDSGDFLDKVEVSLIPTDYSHHVFFQGKAQSYPVDPFLTPLYGEKTIDLVLSVRK